MVRLLVKLCTDRSCQHYVSAWRVQWQCLTDCYDLNPWSALQRLRVGECLPLEPQNWTMVWGLTTSHTKRKVVCFLYLNASALHWRCQCIHGAGGPFQSSTSQTGDWKQCYVPIKYKVWLLQSDTIINARVAFEELYSLIFL